LNTGIESGLTVNEIKEILVHTYAYCGFPRSIRGLQTFIEVLDARAAKGIQDSMGREASPIMNGENKYEKGKKTLASLTKVSPPDKPKGYSAFAPVIDTFLKVHLFCDLFERDVLTHAQREWVTISVIAAIGHAEPMLESHFGICINLGFTPSQLGDFVAKLTHILGEKEIKMIQTSLTQVLKNRSKE
jgi:4-carboxymuconolactone decarboxylase